MANWAITRKTPAIALSAVWREIARQRCVRLTISVYANYYLRSRGASTRRSIAIRRCTKTMTTESNKCIVGEIKKKKKTYHASCPTRDSGHIRTLLKKYIQWHT